MRAKLILIISIFALLVSANLWRADGTYTYPITTKGDLYTFSTAPARLGVGTNNQVLAADSAQATGLKWVSMSSGMAVTSINGDTTSAQVINDDDDILVSSSGGTTTIRRVVAETGAYWLLPNNPPTTLANFNVGANNRLESYRFYLPMRLTVSRVVFHINTASASSNGAAAIYSSDGQTKLVDTGAVDTSTTGTKDTDIANVTLAPGFYWLAVTNSTTAVAFQGNQITGSVLANAIGAWNSTTVHWGNAANSSAAGVMPNTMGTPGSIVTSDTAMSTMAIVKLQGD